MQEPIKLACFIFAYVHTSSRLLQFPSLATCCNVAIPMQSCVLLHMYVHYWIRMSPQSFPSSAAVVAVFDEAWRLDKANCANYFR